MCQKNRGIGYNQDRTKVQKGMVKLTREKNGLTEKNI